MTAVNRRKIIVFVIPLVFVLAVGISVLIGYCRAFARAKADTKETLSLFAQEQVKLLSNTVLCQFELLDVFLSSLPEEGLDLDLILERGEKMREETRYIAVTYVTADGVSHVTDGNTADISNREYFKMTMRGNHMLDKVINDRVYGIDGFVLTAPDVRGGKVRGFIMGVFGEPTFRRILSSSACGGNTYSCVVRSDGEVIVGSSHPNNLLSGSENIFDFFKNASLFENAETDIRRDLKSGRRGSVEFRAGDLRQYAMYLPTGINDTYIFIMVDTKYIEQNAAAATLDYFYLAVAAVLFSGGLILFIVYREKTNRKILEEDRERLKISEEGYKIASEHGERMLSSFDIAARVLTLSKRTQEAFGLPEKYHGLPESAISAGLVMEDSKEAYRGIYQDVFDGKKRGTCHVHFAFPNSHRPRWHLMEYTLIYDTRGIPSRAIFSQVDITERREQELAYERWNQSLLSIPPDKTRVTEYNLTKNTCDRQYGNLLLNAQPSVNEINFQARRFAAQLMNGKDAEAFIGLMNREKLLAAYYDGIREQSLDYMAKTGGAFRWINVKVQLVMYPDSSDIKAFIVHTDITEEKEEELSLLASAREDALTGLLNRKAFTSCVESALRQPAALHALIMIDIDHFKNVNDTFGHGAGDRLLADVAAKLRALSRKDDFLCRFGGDEFMVFMCGVPDRGIARKRAEDIVRALNIRLDKDNATSCSAGVAFYPTDGADFAELYRAADRALYRAKQDGRNRFAAADGEAR